MPDDPDVRARWVRQGFSTPRTITERAVEAASRVLNQDVECRWCYSSRCLAPGHDCIDAVEPDLTLRGIRYAWAAIRARRRATATPSDR